jgi:hypothetical protein
LERREEWLEILKLKNLLHILDIVIMALISKPSIPFLTENLMQMETMHKVTISHIPVMRHVPKTKIRNSNMFLLLVAIKLLKAL